MVRQFMNNWAAFLDHSLSILSHCQRKKLFNQFELFSPVCMLYVFYVWMYNAHDLCILGLDDIKYIPIWSFAKNSVNCLTFRMRGKQVKINYKSILLKLEKHWLEERIFSDEITNYGENMQFFKQ